jgi:TP901 family phage tail tape measure protein
MTPEERLDYVEITARTQALMKGLNAAKRQLQDFGNATKLLGSQLLGMGTAASVPLAASVAMFTSFDDAIRSVRAVTQASEEDFKRLSDEAKRLGATTSYSASEVALLMTELGRAGFDPSQIIAMTGAVMDLARATGTDATLSAGFMSATIRQFGLAAEDATRVADGLTAAANKSFNSVESIGEALKYAAPVAADANMSLEETLAILGTLGNMGIQGSDAGTSLRRLLTLSAAEAQRFQDVFGVATTDAAGNMRPLIDVLGEVTQATKDLPTGERGAKFAQVFGMLGITSASAIGNPPGRHGSQNDPAAQLGLPDDPRAVAACPPLEPGRSGPRKTLSQPANASLSRRPVGCAGRSVQAPPHGRAVRRLGLRRHRVPTANPVATTVRAAVPHLARQGVERAVRAEPAAAEGCGVKIATITARSPHRRNRRKHLVDGPSMVD